MLIVSMLVMMVVIFGGLILVLRKVLSQNVSLATRHLEELNDDYAKKEADLKRQLEDVRQKSEEIIRKAQEEAQQSKAQLMKEAEAQKAKLLQETHTQAEELMQQADKSRQMLLDEIKGRIAKEAVDKACELIHDTLPEAFKLKVHEHWIAELMDSGLEQLEPGGSQIHRHGQGASFLHERPVGGIRQWRPGPGHGVHRRESTDPGIGRCDPDLRRG